MMFQFLIIYNKDDVSGFNMLWKNIVSFIECFKISLFWYPKCSL